MDYANAYRTAEYRGHIIHLFHGDPRGFRYCSSQHNYTVRNGKWAWYRASSGWGESYGRNPASALLGMQQLIDKAIGTE